MRVASATVAEPGDSASRAAISVARSRSSRERTSAIPSSKPFRASLPLRLPWVRDSIHVPSMISGESATNNSDVT